MEPLRSIADIASVNPRESYTPSPRDWRDKLMYLLMVDRFDNDDPNVPPFDPDSAPRGRDIAQGTLFQGGRIGGAKALVGGLLHVKPILTVRNGRVEPLEQQRTARRAVSRLIELVLTQCPRSEDAYVSVMHADAEEQAAALAQEFREQLGVSETPIYQLPPAIVVHGGPGALAASFFRAQTP